MNLRRVASGPVASTFRVRLRGRRVTGQVTPPPMLPYSWPSARMVLRQTSLPVFRFTTSTTCGTLELSLLTSLTELPRRVRLIWTRTSLTGWSRLILAMLRDLRPALQLRRGPSSRLPRTRAIPIASRSSSRMATMRLLPKRATLFGPSRLTRSQQLLEPSSFCWLGALSWRV